MSFELNNIGDFLILMAIGTIGFMAICGFIGIIVILYYDGYLHKWLPFIKDPR